MFLTIRKSLFCLKNLEKKSEYKAGSVRVDKDNNIFAASDKMVTVLDATSSVVIGNFQENDNLSAVGVSPDRKTAVTGSSGGTVRTVDLDSI